MKHNDKTDDITASTGSLHDDHFEISKQHPQHLFIQFLSTYHQILNSGKHQSVGSIYIFASSKSYRR